DLREHTFLAAADQQDAAFVMNGLELTDHVDGVETTERKIDDSQLRCVGLHLGKKPPRLGKLACDEAAGGQHLADEGTDLLLVVENIGHASVSRSACTYTRRRNH